MTSGRTKTPKGSAPRSASEPTLVSIVMPVFNEEENVRRAYEAVCAVFESLERYALEFVFTDNHSTDKTFEILSEMASKDSRIRVIRFARNFGFQRSLMSGYRFARGDVAVQLDCDLQDPPALIVEFLKKWEYGHDVVVGLRRHREESAFITWSRKAFYSLLNRIAVEPLTPNAGDFRLVARSILDQLATIADHQPYVRGIISSLAHNEAGIPYDRVARTRGTSKFPFVRLVGFALDGIVGHSIVPLRVASFFGLFTTAVTFGLIVFYVAGALFFGSNWPAGFATLIIVMLFGIGLNAVFLGIIGEYISRIYLQMRLRPLVIVEQTVNIQNTGDRQ